MFTLLIFLIVIAILVLSHEFGHFIVAKWKGMRVDEFGFGFPPRLFGKQFGDTYYSINLLPFGGFVRVWGEDGLPPEGGDTRSFASRSAWDRFLVLVAGVTMNMILAYVLFSVGHGIGIPSAVEAGDTAREAVVRVVEVIAGSPAEDAGIMPGDAIQTLTVGDTFLYVSEIIDVQDFVQAYAGEEIHVGLSRADEELHVSTFLRKETSAGEGLLGIAMAKIGIVSVPWYQVPWEGLRTTYYTTLAIVFGLAAFFSNIFQIDIAGTVAGPIGIAQITGEASALGFRYLLQLIAVLSINLAVLNLLPIPALDGGRILFLIIEKVRGTPISVKVSQLAHTVGFVVLILLMLIVTFFDLSRIF
jgi:regulator of sigma E protease